MPLNSSIAGNYAFGRNAVVDTNNYTADRYFDNVSLLLHMDGLNGDTNFIDNSPRTKIVTANGAAQITTANSKFGGASGLFDNIDSYLTVPDDPDFNFSSGDWTIELFCRITPVQADILVNKAVGFGFFPVQLRVFFGRFNLRGYTSSLGIPRLAFDIGASSGPIVSPNQWYHVAGVRQGTRFYLYVNGILSGAAIFSGNLYYTTASLSIGGTNNGNGLISGNIDELRITKGVSRYKNGISFVVPKLAFPNNA